MTGSRILAEARPVRSDAKSLLNAPMAPSIRRLISSRSIVPVIRLLPYHSRLSKPSVVGNDGLATATGQYLCKAAFFMNGKYDDRNRIFTCKRYRRDVHDSKSFVKNF